MVLKTKLLEERKLEGYTLYLNMLNKFNLQIFDLIAAFLTSMVLEEIQKGLAQFLNANGPQKAK